MSDERIDELRGEMDQVIAEMEYLTGKLRELRRKQHELATARLMASPRVVAGPLSFRPIPEPNGGDAGANGHKVDSGASESPRCRVLTHPTCGIPCATCDDGGRPDGEARAAEELGTMSCGCVFCDLDCGHPDGVPCTRFGEAA